MKQNFSKHWIGSKLPRKQRKYRANAPSHIRHKLMSASLNPELRKKYGKRNTPLRKDDEVKIMVGEFKGKVGKIDVIDNSNLRISIAGMTRAKKDGSKVGAWFNPSNVQIKELNLEDKQRVKAIERKATAKTEKPVQKLPTSSEKEKLKIKQNKTTK